MDYKTAQSGSQPTTKTLYRQDFNQIVAVLDLFTSTLLNNGVKEN